MKYLREFATVANYEVYINGTPDLPNVSLIVDDNVVYYKPNIMETKLVVYYDIQDISSPTTIYTNYDNSISSIEVDGVLLDSVVTTYQFNSTGEHIIKYEFNTPTSVGNSAPIFYNISIIKKVEIADTFTSIGDNAFVSCSGLTSITIPNSVTSIGTAAYAQCPGLTSITIPDSVTNIGNNAFSACSGLTSITIGNSVTSIGNDAFSNCSGLTSINIPDSVISIGNSAFNGCTHLTSIIIPDSVKSIGSSTFASCTRLTSVTIPDSVTSIGDYAFKNCDDLTSIIIPDSVTSIGNQAFNGCSSLTSITIGNSVTSIGDSVFYNCCFVTSNFINNSSLDEVANNYWGATICDEEINGLLINNHTIIAIRNSNATSITIPDSVTSIGNQAFNGCSYLTSITIPDSVTSIENNAFSNCYFAISNFINNSSLDEVTNNYWGATICDEEINGMLIKDNSIVKFRPNITSAIIPDTVTSIENNVFAWRSNLTSITIPDTVTSIGSQAFYYCSGLTSITSLATTAPAIQSTTFQNVKTDGTLTVPTGATGYDTWMQTGNYYLGKYNWTKVEQ